jgi:hypothetical protein
MEKGKGVKSPTFESFGAWTVELYLGGSGEAKEGYVSLCLIREFGERIAVHYKITIKNSSGGDVPRGRRVGTRDFRPLQPSWDCYDFFPHATIIDGNVLNNGTLTVAGYP